MAIDIDASVTVPSPSPGWAARTIAALLRLPPPTNAVECEHDLPVPMRDGTVLLADHWHPTSGGGPTLLVRSPYGRRSMFGFLYGRVFAERGFQVVVQSCRGTFGSGGAFTPLVDDADDGADTIAWLRTQRWFGGEYATIGASYLGFTQFAQARAAAPELRGLVAQVAPHDFGHSIRPSGALALDSALGFAVQVTGPERSGPFTLLSQVLERHRLRAAFAGLPLDASCRRALGKRVGWFDDWLEHDEPDGPYWAQVDHTEALEELEADVLLQGGWYDLFATSTVAQYAALKRRGRTPYLTMGPWTHSQFGTLAWRSLAPETLAWLRSKLLGRATGLRRKPVRAYILGARKHHWREFDDWPPPGATEQAWYLAAGRTLSTACPEVEVDDAYRYDPADPTPSIGGPLLFFGAGPKDNRKLEERADVLTYTAPILERDTVIVGSPTVELFGRTTARSTDLFARLCDVHPNGRSINLCDAIVRISARHQEAGGDEEAGHDGEIEPDGAFCVQITLSPIAACLRRGHRLRLQVSSGAHPRYARNLGGGDPVATATQLVRAEQTITAGGARGSSVRCVLVLG